MDSNGFPFVPQHGFYQPSTEDTREAYQALLTIIEHQLGARSEPIMCVVAEEILSILKSKSFTFPIAQKAEIEKLLHPLPDYLFDQLVLIARVITDYHQVSAPAEKGFYQPRCDDTWIAYKLLLDVIECKIGSGSLIYQCLMAHDILLILKNDNLDVYAQKNQIVNHLGGIDDDTFDLLVNIGVLISDFDDFKDDERVGADVWENSRGIQERQGWESDEDHQIVMNRGDGVCGFNGNEVKNGLDQIAPTGWEEEVKDGVEVKGKETDKEGQEPDRGTVDGGDWIDWFEGLNIFYSEKEEEEEEEEDKESDDVQVDDEEHDCKEEDKKHDDVLVDDEESEHEQWVIIDYHDTDE